jgi:hypothetical protein
MLSPTFRFFEIICGELSALGSTVLTRADLALDDKDAPLLDELKDEYKVATSEEAIDSAIKALNSHFESKGSRLPFSYDSLTGRFSAEDPQYLEFVEGMQSIRSLGKRSRDFEIQVADRLVQKVTGNVHRVGFPREIKRNAPDFRAHLKTLGFGANVLLGKEKDGGLDILWLLPLGSIPHRPIVSVQCKNGEFSLKEADASVGAGGRSLSCHLGLQTLVHVPCVLFNDYIVSDQLIKKPFNFVPLGLSDLSVMLLPTTIDRI